MASSPWTSTSRNMLRRNEVNCYFGLLQNLDKSVAVGHFDVGEGVGVGPESADGFLLPFVCELHEILYLHYQEGALDWVV